MLLLKKIIPLVISVVAVFFVSYFWSKISLPYDTTNSIIGEYSEKYHNQFNDTLRFILFLFLPLIAFTGSYMLINKIKIKSLSNFFFNQQNILSTEEKNYEKNIYFLILILILFINFISSNLPDYKLDIFHEGQLLSGALNYNLKNQLWTGSYINTGLFYDIINTKISWLLFDKETVGAYRMFSFVLNYIYTLFVIFLIFQTSKIFNFPKEKGNIFFIVVSIFCFYFFNIKSSNFPNYRDLFTICFLICLLNAIIFEKFKYINYFLIGSFSVVSLLWSLDRGIFLNVTIIVILIVFLLQKRFVPLLTIFFGILTFWLLFYFFIGKEEFNAFLFNSVNIIKYNEIWNGLIHPQPFSDEKNSTRATKALLLYVINGIIIIKYIIDNNKLNQNTKLFLAITFLIGIFYYKVGLSRSDGGHIIIGSSFNYLLFIILITYEFLSVDFNKLIKIDILNLKILPYLLIIIFLITNFNQKSNFNHSNMVTVISRIKNFVEKEDNYFLKENYVKFIEKTNFILNNEECIQSFNYDPTIYYILKKKSCTQYYLIFNMATINDQKTFIEQLQTANSDYIIVDKNNSNHKYSADQRLPVISNYLNLNYKVFSSINEANILVKKN